MMYNKVYSDRSQLDLSDSIFVKSYDEKTAENYRICYVAEMRIVSKLTKTSIPNTTIDSIN